MSSYFSVFVRTAESVWEFKSFFEKILNCWLEEYPNFNDESFHATVPGITFHLQTIDETSNNILVQYNDEMFLLSPMT